MPNRLIRDGLLESEAVLSVPIEARWLYVSILLSADDVGLFEATPFRLARRADIRRECVDGLLQLLVDADLVRLYDVDGKRFGFIPRFGQRIQIKRIRHAIPPMALIQDDEDAIQKIKHIASKTASVQQNVTAAHLPEPEPEPEPEPKTVGEGRDRGANNAPPTASPARATRGSRLPNDWELPSAWADFARQERPHWTPEQLRRVADTFRDHWVAASGSRGVKADWSATWRNWVRKEGGGSPAYSRAPPLTGRAARMDSYAAQAAAARANMGQGDGLDDDERIIDGRAVRIA